MILSLKEILPIAMRKWMVLVGTTWIQALAGTNVDFSTYSSNLKWVLDISQVELNYIGVASDMGKALGWCSGIALLYLPPWIVLLVSAFVGFLGYGLQWLLDKGIFSMPYCLVLVLSLLAGCSITWLNTVCYVLCIKCFPENRGLALSLTTCYTGVSAALYNLIANSIDPNDTSLRLLLNAIFPLITSILALPLIIHHSPSESLPPDNPQHDSAMFVFLTAVAAITGLHLLLNSKSSNTSTARAALAVAILLLALPLITLGMLYLWNMSRKSINPSFQPQGPSFSLIDDEDDDVLGELMEETNNASTFKDSSFHKYNNTVELGEEHSTFLLVRQLDFWLYYFAYFCGGTIGLVYSNNLGQISESLGYSAYTNSLVALYSACSFFGRLLSTFPDFLQAKVHFARTLWFTLAILPTPAAFMLLALSANEATLATATAFIGLSTGFVFSAAVSVTSELFGPNRAGVNHNILITNIPIGSLLYSLLAALVYEANIENSKEDVSKNGCTTVCIGKNCFEKTFLWWWLISLVGLVSSSLLSLRTKTTYDRLEKQKRKPKVTLMKPMSL